MRDEANQADAREAGAERETVLTQGEEREAQNGSMGLSLCVLGATHEVTAGETREGVIHKQSWE